MTRRENFMNVMARQIDWSKRTFGPDRRTLGITEHIALELDEIKAEPDDLEEWVDVMILGFDGAWRTGHSPTEILEAYERKMNKNFARKWPKYEQGSEDQAILHTKEGTQ